MQRLTLILIVFLLLYPLTYFALTRTAMYLNSYPGDPDPAAIYFLPMHIDYPDVLHQCPRLKKLHKAAVYFYYPVWWLDHHLLGGPDYYSGFTFDEVTDDDLWHE